MNDLSNEQDSSLSFSIKTEDEANDDRSSNLETSANNISVGCEEINAFDEMQEDMHAYNEDNDNHDSDEANNNQSNSNRDSNKSFDLSSNSSTPTQNPKANIQQLKKHMTLDLDAKTSLKKARKALLSGCLPMFANQSNIINQNNQRSSASLLSSTTPLLAGTNLWTPTGFVQLESPDLRKCQLPTPELDRFILNNTNIHLTPTPSLANPHFAFDKALERIKMKDEANQATAAAAALAAVTNSNHNLANGFTANHLNNHNAGHHLNHHNNSLNAVAAAAAAALHSPLLQFPSLTGVSNGNAAAMAAAAAAAVVANSNNHHHSNHPQHLSHHSNMNNNNINGGSNHLGHQNNHQISSPTEEALLAQLIDQTPLDSMELQYKINQLLQRAVEFDANKSLSSHQHTATSGMVGLSTISNSDSNSRPPSNASSSMYAMNLNGGLESCDSNSAPGLNSRANSSIGTSSNVANSNSNRSARGSNKTKTNGNSGNNSSNVQMETIDFEDQERMKLERKRMRNRIAASKCRKRKLERISKLEDKVKELKDENADLSGIIFKLREHVCQLKAEMMEHVKSGCNINPSLAQS